jgi:hypothetical protein
MDEADYERINRHTLSYFAHLLHKCLEGSEMKDLEEVVVPNFEDRLIQERFLLAKHFHQHLKNHFPHFHHLDSHLLILLDQMDKVLRNHRY